jgi:hypothetical protein
MITRTSRKIVTFTHAFILKGVDRALPPGAYPVITDEELIEGLSFAAYRRVSTIILVPTRSHRASSLEMVTIDPADLQAARDRDAATLELLPTNFAAQSDGNRTERIFPTHIKE